jgi:hypothetical protein
MTEILPKLSDEIKYKIFYYLSHPTANIIKQEVDSAIAEYSKLLKEIEPTLTYEDFFCGNDKKFIDVYSLFYIKFQDKKFLNDIFKKYRKMYFFAYGYYHYT